MHKSFIILFLALALHAEDSLPPAPTGFSAQRLLPIKSFLLKPDGWYFKQSGKGQTDGFYITKEDIDKSGAFKTGLTLNCVRNIQKKTGQTPAAYAASLADAAAMKYELIERMSSQQRPF